MSVIQVCVWIGLGIFGWLSGVFVLYAVLRVFDPCDEHAPFDAIGQFLACLTLLPVVVLYYAAKHAAKYTKKRIEHTRVCPKCKSLY